jgi:hypothetical protein
MKKKLKGRKEKYRSGRDENDIKGSKKKRNDINLQTYSLSVFK